MKFLFCAALLLLQDLFAADCLPKRDIQDYRTITSTIDQVKMHLHFPSNKEGFALRALSILEAEASKIHNYFKSRPRTDVHWVIDQAIDSNGMATVFPYNIVTLFDFPPTENNYLAKTQDWVKNLVIHEYVHIVTMDMTKGWIDSLRTIFGSVVKTNGVIPKWMTEGVAVWYESQETGQGRLSQPEVRWQVFHALKDKNFCQQLACLDEPMTYPYGHAPYWIGGAFVEYLEQQKAGFISCFYQEHARHVPFLMNRIFNLCGLENVESMYQRFKTDYLQNDENKKLTCPWADHRCDHLTKHKLNNALVDYQIGSCQIENQFYFVTREEKGRTRQSQAFKILNLDLVTGEQNHIFPRYPIELMQESKGKCLVKQRADFLCQQEAHYYELSKEKIDFIKTSSAVTMNYDSQNNSWQEDVYSGDFDASDAQEIKNDYPARKFLKPEYFLFDYSNFANLSAINLNTVLVDPLKKHTFSLSLTTYFPENESPLLGESMFYRLSSNNWSFNLYYTKFYFTNAISEEISQSEQMGSAWQKIYRYQNWRMQGSIKGNHFLGDDFISKREVNSVQLQHQMQMIQNSQDSPLKNLSMSVSLGQFSAQSGGTDKDYSSFETSLQHSYFLGVSSEMGQRLQFGKYFKDDLRSGYLAAGGVNNFFANGYPYPLYTVGYLDLLGNELLTTSLFWNGLISNHYQGRGLVPLFLKDTRLEVGAEYAKSDFYLTMDKIYYHDYVTGFYLKYTFNLRLAYIWDASFSLAFAQTQQPITNNRFLLLFDAVAF